MGRPILLISVAATLGLGLMFLLIPDRMLAPVDLSLDSATARAEIRAFYGGFQLGVGAFLLWCWSGKRRVRTGLILATLIWTGSALGRIVGIISDPDQGWIIYVFLALDILGALLSGAGYVIGDRMATLQEPKPDSD